jgi:hypothetical protein
VKRFYCQCGQELFFENSFCFQCRSTVGFDPSTFDMVLQASAGEITRNMSGRSLRACDNWTRHGVCNWWLPVSDGSALCRSCRLNTVIPNLEHPENYERWSKLEVAKRRLLYTVLDLELPFASARYPLRFQFLEDQRTNDEAASAMVYTGHNNGTITILAAEADDLFREDQRLSMAQRYRTLLGHMRHESGHYFWPLLVQEGGRIEEFRELFGDERADYAAALERFYETPGKESPDFVSVYAQAHPAEDWAESFSHALHIFDTVETAVERELLPASAMPSPDAERLIDDALLDRFAELAVSLNELNRSLGLKDAYPFVLGGVVREKLRFIGSVVSRAARAR